MKFIPYREFFFWTIFLGIVATIFLVGCFSSFEKNHGNKGFTQTIQIQQSVHLTKS